MLELLTLCGFISFSPFQAVSGIVNKSKSLKIKMSWRLTWIYIPRKRKKKRNKIKIMTLIKLYCWTEVKSLFRFFISFFSFLAIFICCCGFAISFFFVCCFFSTSGIHRMVRFFIIHQHYVHTYCFNVFSQSCNHRYLQFPKKKNKNIFPLISFHLHSHCRHRIFIM